MNDLEVKDYITKNIKTINLNNLTIMIKEIKTDAVILDILLTNLNDIGKDNLFEIIKRLNDTIKIELLHLFDMKEQIELIKSLNEDENKIKFIDNRKYLTFQTDIIASLKNYENILFYFNRSNSLKYKIEIINLVKNLKTKIKLIKLIDHQYYKIFILSNFEPYKSMIIKNSSIAPSINHENGFPDITIGIELEVLNDNISLYSNVATILEEFRVKEESTLSNGFEIISPKLNYTHEDMQKLNTICNILKTCGFYTSNSCGGHIHIGIDCINNVEQIFTLLYIYCNCENIFYLISNKEGSKPRRQVKIYASKIKKIYELAIRKKDFENVGQDIEKLLKKLKKINFERYKGLNINTNIRTIEFRIPNGEINFYELFCNIKLFVHLIQVSCKIPYLDENDKRNSDLALLRKNITEEEKLELLLDILFTDESDKMIYRNRYYKNTNFLSRRISNVQSLYFNKGIDFKKRRLKQH